MMLPLGWRVLQRINKIIREEMNAIGGQEVLDADHASGRRVAGQWASPRYW